MTVEIETGLFDCMVLQRNRRGVSNAAFSGKADMDGQVLARVRRGTRAVAGFRDVRVGRVVSGRMTGRLRGLPTGGPYDVRLSIRDASGACVSTCEIMDVLVGDVWLLAGQSNMQGVGLLKDRSAPDDRVRAFYMDDRWAAAEESVHNMHRAVDDVHRVLCGGVLPPRNSVTGVGPGVAFGLAMLEGTGVPQGIVACAHGGTTMEQWDPKLKRRGGSSLYGAMVRRLTKNGGKVAGLFWYQGCSDAHDEGAAAYTRRMKALMRAVRRDTGDARLPVVVVQISRVLGWPPETSTPWNSVQDQQRRLADCIERLAVVPAIDLSLDDTIHISGRDQKRLGGRAARAMRVLRGGRGIGRPPIALKGVRIVDNVHEGMADVVVDFANVEGGLQAGSRPWGFSVVNVGSDENWILDVELKGGRAVLHTALPEQDLADCTLHYGFGTNPYVNITDAADRSIPVFGPVRIGKRRALTPFVRTWRVSPILKARVPWTDLALPVRLGKLGLVSRSFAADFAGRHEEIAEFGSVDGILHYAVRVRCSEPMDLSAQVGYDGPLKLWLDGRLVLDDATGTNPAAVGDGVVRFKAARGEHEFLATLGTNGGAAWGVCLRFQRHDVSKRDLEKDPAPYAMPEFLG